MDLKTRLESHPISVLKKEVSKFNIKGYSKMKKDEVIKLMLKNKKRFDYIQIAEKKIRAPLLKKSDPPKKKVIKKAEPKKEPVKKKVIKKPEPKKEVKKPEPPKPNASELNLKRVKELLNSSSYKNKNIYQKNDVLGFEIQRIVFPTRYTYSPAEGRKQEAYKILEREREKISKEIEKDNEAKLKKAGETIKQMELADKFYKELNTLLKGSTRAIRSAKKDFGLSDEEIKKTFENQQYADFFPTPANCLKVYNKEFKNSSKMLEGTAGLGSVVHYAKRVNGGLDITANELSKDFIPIIKKFNPDVKTMNKDFFDLPLTSYDLIFLNPPFSRGGRGARGFKGKDSKFYYNFLYHTIINLNKFKQQNKSNKLFTLLFISPALTNERESVNSVILNGDVIKKMGINKLNEILKDNKIKELTKKQFTEYLEEGMVEGNDDIEVLLEPIQINFVEKCSNFGGTGVTAHEYIITI